jgi:glycosyltransferase involved in cell wall biosynthesis
MYESELRLSIIVPVHNDARNLVECLTALKTAAIPGSELIVVDDASTDDPSAVAKRLGASPIRLEQHSGPSTARNRGAAVACGEILFFVDSDVAVAPDAVRRVDAAFSEEPQLGAVFGSYDSTPWAPGVVSQYRNLLHHFVHQHGDRDASTFWAGCGAIRRACFTEVGGFDDGQFKRSAIEDIELGYRLRRRGYRILLDRQLQGKHLKVWTFSSVVKTDIFSRAVPWSLLVLRGGGAPNDLNLKFGQRVSGLLVLLAAAAMLLTPFHLHLLAISVLALGAVVALNWPLYRFFLARRGVWFLARALPLHWLYYLYSSLTYLAVYAVVQVRQLVGAFTPHADRDTSE